MSDQLNRIVDDCTRSSRCSPKSATLYKATFRRVNGNSSYNVLISGVGLKS
jgi:hypothetical protein